MAGWTLDHFIILFWLLHSFTRKKVKFTFQSTHLSCKKETFFLYENKERHFVKCVQICFFLVYSKDIGKLPKTGPSLSAVGFQKEPDLPPASGCSWTYTVLWFSWVTTGQGVKLLGLVHTLRDWPTLDRTGESKFLVHTCLSGWALGT